MSKTINRVLKVMKAFTWVESPRPELRYVFYDAAEKRLVATDLMMMLIVGYTLDSDKNLLIDVNNVSEGGECISDKYRAFKEKDAGCFPDYKKALVKKGKLTKPISENLSFAECLINAGAITGEPIMVPFKKAYNKLDMMQENTRIHYTAPNKPFMLSGLVDFGKKREIILSTKFVISPIFL